MKKNNQVMLLATLVYSFLFYHQHAGINFLLFSSLLVGCLWWVNPSTIKNKTWLLYALLSIFAGFFILIHGSTLAIWANIISLLLLSATSVNQQSSVLFNLFYGTYSIAGALIFILIGFIKPKAQLENSTKKGSFIKYLTYIIPIALTLVFFFIYKNANPLFERFTEKINVD